MRPSTVDMMNKVKALLIDNERMTAAEITAKTHLSKASIYLMMKRLNENGTPVYSSKKGYILAEYADQRDDVHFLRKINGYHAGSCARLQAAFQHIQRRWRGEKQQSLLMDMVRPMQTQKALLSSAQNAVLTCVNKLGL